MYNNRPLQDIRRQLDTLLVKHRQMETHQVINQDRYYELKKKLARNRNRLQYFTSMIKAAGASDRKIDDLTKELDVALRQLKVYEDEVPNEEQGWFKWIMLAIPRAIWWVLKSAINLICKLLSCVFSGLFKASQEIDQTNSERIRLLRGMIQQKQGRIRDERSSQNFLIHQIAKFEKQELPEILSFCGQLEKIL